MKQIILSFSFGRCFLKKSAQKRWLYVCNSKFGEMYYIKVKHGIYDMIANWWIGIYDMIALVLFSLSKSALEPVPPPQPFDASYAPGWKDIYCNLKSYLLCETISHHFRYCKQLNCNSLCRWSISSPKELQYNRKCHALIRCITSSYLGNKIRLNNISHYPDFIPCVGLGSKGPFHSKV
jgi:hypothetical protein